MSRTRPAVKAVIEDDGEYLLIQQWTESGPVWTLPGGGIEPGETRREALERELDEEISIDVDVGRSVGEYSFTSTRNGNEPIRIVATVYRCENPVGEVDVAAVPGDEEIADYRWVSADELADYDLDSDLRDVFDAC